MSYRIHTHRTGPISGDIGVVPMLAVSVQQEAQDRLVAHFSREVQDGLRGLPKQETAMTVEDAISTYGAEKHLRNHPDAIAFCDNHETMLFGRETADLLRDRLVTPLITLIDGLLPPTERDPALRTKFVAQVSSDIAITTLRNALGAAKKDQAADDISPFTAERVADAAIATGIMAGDRYQVTDRIAAMEGTINDIIRDKLSPPKGIVSVEPRDTPRENQPVITEDQVEQALQRLTSSPPDQIPGTPGVRTAGQERDRPGTETGKA